MGKIIPIAVMIYHKQTTTSTNDDARDKQYGHLDAIWAEHQSSGRGQRGHVWLSDEGQNLTFSVVLTPEFLPISEQFLLSEIVALAIVDTLDEYGIAAQIKWTNDIYVGGNKIAGILIEHSLSGDCLTRTIAGIGLNVNQVEFSSDLPNPISMTSVTGRSYDRRELLETILRKLEALYNQLQNGGASAIQKRYIATMYLLDKKSVYALPNGEQFEATIRGVLPTGHLRLEHGDGIVRDYAFKEVEFVLPHKR